MEIENENISRRDMLKGAAVAAAALGVAGLATGCAPQTAAETPAAASAASASNETAGGSSMASTQGTSAQAESTGGYGFTRNDGAGFNAGWGDTTIEDYSGKSFDEVLDGWFNYDWNYTREFAEPLDRPHVCVLVSSATVGGNGDTLAQTVVDEIGDAADVEVVHLRNLLINPVMQIGSEPPVSSTTTVIDGMDTVIQALHRADTVIAIAPTYFNNVHGRMMDTITRTWMPCWRNDSYAYGPVKRTGVMLTCTGAPADYLKTVTRAFFTMADLSIISPEYRTEVFNGCGTPDTVANTPEFLETARSLARWAIRAEDTEA